MKLMTYNILDGGVDRLGLIIEAITSVGPDYLTINEANTFAADGNKVLKEVSSKIGLPYCDIALSGEYDYHVAVFSKYPLETVQKIQPLKRACIIATVKTDVGELSIASLHMNPYAEDLRREEIERVLSYQNKFEKRILMGDMNSLSWEDGYNPKMVQEFNDIQKKKYTKNGKLRFDVISTMTGAGYNDSAVVLKKNNISTVPTPMNEGAAHGDVRLDYIFVSRPLVSHLANYEVIKNEVTKKASDHYPVVVEIT